MLDYNERNLPFGVRWTPVIVDSEGKGREWHPRMTGELQYR